LLKVKPTKRFLQRLAATEKESVTLLLGLRDSESSTRGRNMKSRYGNRVFNSETFTTYYLGRERIIRIKKVVPMKTWDECDVWSMMITQSDIDISELLNLYKSQGARFGCWFCTLARLHRGLHAFDGVNFLYLDAARLLCRKISDLPDLRLRKRWGYSNYGALHFIGRAILLKSFQASEKLSGIRLYGLDEAKVKRGFSLRQLLYELDPEEAQKIILEQDAKIDRKRIINIEELRSPPRKYRSKILHILARIEKDTQREKSRKLALNRGTDPIKELIKEIATMI